MVRAPHGPWIGSQHDQCTFTKEAAEDLENPRGSCRSVLDQDTETPVAPDAASPVG